MRPKALLITLFLLGAAALAQAQDDVTLNFGADGPREAWTTTGPPGKPAPDSVRSDRSIMPMSFKGKKDSDALYVVDKTTGNLAGTTVGAVRKTGNWQVAPESYKLIGQVSVKVEHSGQPLAAGEVSLDDGVREQKELLDPSTNGKIDFFGIKPGSLKITARYKAKDGTSKSVTQLLDAPLTRTTPIPSAVISVPEDVAVVGTAAPASSDKPAVPASSTPAAAPAGAQASGKPAESANPIGSLVVYLVGIAVAGGVIYLAFKYAKQNPELVQSKLTQLGVDIPQPGDATQGQQYDPVPAPMPKKQDPPQKIILDGAAPDPIAPFAASTAVSVGEPRLTSDAGDAMILPEGETVVGREVGLGLSLVGETTVSRQHAKLFRSGNEVTLTDLGSTNGTYVNGVQLNGGTTLRHGDSVQFGAVRFRYEG
ncbi:FHA domain-containing protein [Fimbriimonas ginsengisoli]|uniref:Alkaline serine protease, subtilase family n=1 Tax=Fimbriimonas ginsengisoli Gsoil 348 TaxID=661478 RepID=A0A068NMG6_FIMGI|nr:FHA domain-containing protein [Fimbriimonas ginsengisoli]AIE84768.1 Alkaline serine protease, subtilase family [Fimbriimonas ginsengisoli Gsoil 348]